MLRPLVWCLGLGAASTALTVVTGGAAAPFATALVGGLAGGAAGNFGHEVCKVLDRRVAGKLLDGRSGIAENHVVAQTLRLAQFKALGIVLERFGAARAGNQDSKWRGEADRFSAELGRFVVEQTKSAETLAFASGDEVTVNERELRQAVLNTLPDVFDQGLASRRMSGEAAAITTSLGQIRRMVEGAVLAELRLTLLAPGEEPPPPFPALFAGTTMPDGWFDLFLRDAADRIKNAESKDGGAFEKIWNAEQTAIIKAIVQAHSEILRDIKHETLEIRRRQDDESALAAARHEQQTARQRKLERLIVGIERADHLFLRRYRGRRSAADHAAPTYAARDRA
jgi:hypothetical protein